MRREVLGEDKNVIHIEQTERKITQNLKHKALEHVSGVLKAKGHTQELEHFKWGDDGGLLDLLGRNRYLITSFMKV